MQLSRIGPIALEEPLGGDPHSNVLRGVHVERNLTLAVKLLPRELVNQTMGGDTFVADVKTLQKLVHPGIARVLGGAMDNGQPYLAMELVEGESLRSRLDRLGRLPWETTVEIAEAMCAALDYAHKSGVPHLRLTPSRVLLPKEGGVKLVGFDCAWSDRDAVLGLKTPIAEGHYFPQEVFRGKKSSHLPTCDLFSLGVILYECLAGQMPWPTRRLVELVQIRREKPAPRVSASVLECPVWLDALVARLLEVRRANRLQSAEETHRAIAVAKRKVAEGSGAAKQAWSGQRGALTLDHDRREISKLRRKFAARTERDTSPFFERAWFLAACLAAVVAAGAWIFWPASEEALFAKAKPLMASDSVPDWRRARDGYLAELLERFPNTSHRAEIDQFEQRYAMHEAEARIKRYEVRGQLPESELDRLYAEARRYERFGDRITAWQKYEALLALFPHRQAPDEQAVINLSRQAVARLKGAAQMQLELSGVVRQKVDEAAALLRQGQTMAARQVLDGVVSLYDGNREVAPLVEEARQMIRQLHANAAEPTAPNREAAK